jgi:predicted nucleic acid-binding protein
VTLVADTSVVLPALVDGGSSGDRARVSLSGDDLFAPALLDVEVAAALRGRVLGGRLSVVVAGAALRDLADLPIRRFDAVPLLPRIWELRGNLTAYDAAYVALAEMFAAELVTADERLVKSSGPRCRFRLVPVGD